MTVGIHWAIGSGISSVAGGQAHSAVYRSKRVIAPWRMPHAPGDVPCGLVREGRIFGGVGCLRPLNTARTPTCGVAGAYHAAHKSVFMDGSEAALHHSCTVDMVPPLAASGTDRRDEVRLAMLVVGEYDEDVVSSLTDVSMQAGVQSVVHGRRACMYAASGVASVVGGAAGRVTDEKKANAPLTAGATTPTSLSQTERAALDFSRCAFTCVGSSLLGAVHLTLGTELLLMGGVPIWLHVI